MTHVEFHQPPTRAVSAGRVDAADASRFLSRACCCRACDAGGGRRCCARTDRVDYTGLALIAASDRGAATDQAISLRPSFFQQVRQDEASTTSGAGRCTAPDPFRSIYLFLNITV